MIKPWTRDDTKEWISQLEHRLEDIEYYLRRTEEWCDEYGVDDDRVVFMCNFLTCIWVSELRGGTITYLELMELLGIEVAEIKEEKIFELDEKWIQMEHHELLEKAVQRMSDIDWEED